MHYYIDGYNLLFRIARGNEDDLKTQRQKIIQDLNEKIQFLELDITLVFDSQYRYGESSRSQYNFLEILFSAEGETADDLIISELKSSPNPRQEIVVTSDKYLAWRARRLSAKTESVDEFIGWLSKRSKKRQKEFRERKTFEPKTVILEPAKAVGPPVQGTTPEECFDYYLSKFEKNFEEIAKTEPPKKEVEKKNLKINKQKVEEEEDHLSDEERWLKIFEERSKAEKDDQEKF